MELKENELEDLDAELKLLNNAEQVKQQLNAVYGQLTEGDEPVSQTIKALAQKLSSLHQYHSGIEELQKRLLSFTAQVFSAD